MKRVLAVAVVSLLLLPGVAAAQREPEPAGPLADMRVQLQGPVPAPLVGTSFKLVYTVANDGPEAATDASLSQYIPGELAIQSASSSDGSECTFGETAGPTTAEPPPPPPSTAPAAEDGSTSGGGYGSPGYYGDAVSCLFGTMSSGSSTVVTLDLRRVGARETYTSAWVGSSLNDPAYENNYVDLQLAADTSEPADVGVTIDSPKSPEVGGNFDYTLTVTNKGPEPARGTTLFNPIGYGLTFVSASPVRDGDSCAVNDYSDPDVATPDYGGYSELLCELAALAPGSSASIHVTVTRASAYEIWNSASVQTTNYDPNYENDYAYSVIAADPSVTSDLTIRMNGPGTTPLVGETFSLTATVSNGGPAPSGDTWLSISLASGIDFVSASEGCTYNDYGAWPVADAPESAPTAGGDAYYPIGPGSVYCTVGRIDPGSTVGFEITLTRTAAREIWTSGWTYSSNHDPNYDDNYTDVVIAPDTSKPADVSLTMTAPQKPEVGSDFAFTIAATNHGPSPAENVRVENYLPYGVDLRGVTSDDASDSCTFQEDRYDSPPPGSEMPAYFGLRLVTCDLGTLDPGATGTVSVDVTRTSEYEIWNSAWVSTSNYDENYENDYASTIVEGEPYPGACPLAGTAEGTDGSDQIVIGPCYAETAGGADSVEMLPPSAGDSGANTGAGRDTINVNLTSGSSTQRSIEVNSGPGADLVRISVAPGAGNATIYVAAGRGNDRIEIGSVIAATGLKIVVLGQRGDDDIVASNGSTSGSIFSGFTLKGGSGIDLLNGGPGDDLLSGGRNRDRLYGELGDDILRGGPAVDLCRGGPGDNRLRDC